MKDIEHRGDGSVGAEADAAADTNVVVGDHRHRGVAEAEFSRQVALGVLGHVHQRPALAGVPPALGSGREARPLDDRHGPAPVGSQASVAAGRRAQRSQPWAVGICHRYMDELGCAVGVTPPGKVDELVGDDKVTGAHSALQAAGDAGGENLSHAERAQRRDVGAVGDLMRRQCVVGTVAREKRQRAGEACGIAVVADADRVRGLAVGRQPNRVDHGEHVLPAEAGTADHGHDRLIGHGHPPRRVGRTRSAGRRPCE